MLIVALVLFVVSLLVSAAITFWGYVTSQHGASGGWLGLTVLSWIATVALGAMCLFIWLLGSWSILLWIIMAYFIYRAFTT